MITVEAIHKKGAKFTREFVKCCKQRLKKLEIDESMQFKIFYVIFTCEGSLKNVIELYLYLNFPASRC